MCQVMKNDKSWRGMLLKDNEGDWGVAVAAWRGMKKGQPGIPGNIQLVLQTAISCLTSFVQYNRPSLPVLFWRVVFLNTTLQDRQPAKPDLAVPRLV